MLLLFLHQKEDENKQTLLFAAARAMYQHRSLLMQLFYQKGLVCTGGIGCCSVFPFVLNQDLKKAVSIASKNSNVKMALLLKPEKKFHRCLIEFH